jgi:hypothetical protein
MHSGAPVGCGTNHLRCHLQRCRSLYGHGIAGWLCANAGWQLICNAEAL